MSKEEQKYKIRKPDYAGGAVAEVVLSNPAKHNVFDDTLIAGLTGAFLLLGDDPETRVILLRAEGKSFSAGADLNWMKRAAENTEAENLADAEALASMLRVIDHCPKPVIGLVQGAAYGGGVGLVSCCDIAIATQEAKFALTEVKLGIIPAAISPFVVSAIGAQASRRYMLTAESFDGSEARRLGLVHRLVPHADLLESAGRDMATALLHNGPNAIAETKALIRAVDRPWTWDVMKDTAGRIARVRASEEGREGVSAFLEKRAPSWRGSD